MSNADLFPDRLENMPNRIRELRRDVNDQDYIHSQEILGLKQGEMALAKRITELERLIKLAASFKHTHDVNISDITMDEGTDFDQELASITARIDTLEADYTATRPSLEALSLNNREQHTGINNRHELLIQRILQNDRNQYETLDARTNYLSKRISQLERDHKVAAAPAQNLHDKLAAHLRRTYWASASSQSWDQMADEILAVLKENE